MFHLRLNDGRFLKVGIDSLGYTVEDTTEVIEYSTSFGEYATAKEVLDSLDYYWREQCYIYHELF